MSQKREHESRPAQEDSSPDPEPRSESRENGGKVSALADEVLADIDEALQEALGIDKDADVDAKDLAALADRWVKSYVQKGGQ